jgi:hypothetical protein
VKNAVISMEKHKVAGPDGLPAEFYQDCSEIIKDDLLGLFEDLSNNS